MNNRLIISAILSITASAFCLPALSADNSSSNSGATGTNVENAPVQAEAHKDVRGDGHGAVDTGPQTKGEVRKVDANTGKHALIHAGKTGGAGHAMTGVQPAK